MKELLAQIDTLNTQIENGLREYIRSFLVENPHIKYLPIVGYTPSFNDGDPCEFSANVDYDHDIDEIFGDDEDMPYETWYESLPHDFNFVEPEIAHKSIQDAFARMYGEYGFFVLYSLDENETLVERVTEYDCGY